MTTMAKKVQGVGLAFLSKIAKSDLVDQLKLRKVIEKSLYHGAKTGFSALSRTQKIFQPSSNQLKQRLPTQDDQLFDLNLTEEQKMTVETMQKFATEVLSPLAHDADHQAIFPPELWQHAQTLGLNFYALPESYQGVATEKQVVSHILIAEHLARGDFSLAAAMLCNFSVINCITQWGSELIQNTYLCAFAEQPDLQASFAVQEDTPAFDPYHLKTTAHSEGGQFYLNGKKSLVLLGETADILLVSAEFNQRPNLFIVERNDHILVKKSPAMGLKAAETVELIFKNTPAQRLGDDDFDYTACIDLGNLMWCALAVGCCEAVKAYCINYANQRMAFEEPISHRQGIAFMIADMAIEIDAMRILLLNAASLADSGQKFHREAYLARILCAEKAMKIATDGVQILGGHGYTKEHPVERWYRDLRATAIMHAGLHA